MGRTEEAEITSENEEGGRLLGRFDLCLICSSAYRIIFIGLETILKPCVVHQNGIHFSQRKDLVKPLEM